MKACAPLPDGMSGISYRDVFKAAFGSNAEAAPYAWQCGLPLVKFSLSESQFSRRGHPRLGIA